MGDQNGNGYGAGEWMSLGQYGDGYVPHVGGGRLGDGSGAPLYWEGAGDGDLNGDCTYQAETGTGDGFHES